MQAELNHLWDHLHDSLLRYVKKKGVTAEHAQDIVQEVFLKVHDNVDTLKGRDRIVAWIFSIARNTVTDFYRKNGSGLVNIEYIHPCMESEDNTDMTIEFTSCIHHFLPFLPKQSRDVLIRVELGDLSQKELADQLGLPYSTVKSRVQRARQRLRELIEECCVVEHDRFGNIIHYQKRTACC